MWLYCVVQVTESHSQDLIRYGVWLLGMWSCIMAIMANHGGISISCHPTYNAFANVMWNHQENTIVQNKLDLVSRAICCLKDIQGPYRNEHNISTPEVRNAESNEQYKSLLSKISNLLVFMMLHNYLFAVKYFLFLSWHPNQSKANN